MNENVFEPDPSKPVSVVTGGAGFIGSHLCKQLLAIGHTVVCIDSFITGSPANLSDIVSDDFHVFEMNINTATLSDGHIDYVFNLACPASPVAYSAYPLETLQCGSTGVWNVMQMANAAGARFLQASTSEVYGDPTVNPQPESYNGNVSPTGPRSMYDESKRYSEALIMAFGNIHTTEDGFGTRIARIFNTYGPNMQIDDGRVIPNFISQALNNKPLTVYGDGSQTRSLCYVDDTVDGLIKLMMSDYCNPVNIGNPYEITVRKLAELIIDMTKSKSTVIEMPLPKDDPKMRCPDIGLARDILQWEPKVTLYDGILKTISAL